MEGKRLAREGRGECQKLPALLRWSECSQLRINKWYRDCISLPVSTMSASHDFVSRREAI